LISEISKKLIFSYFLLVNFTQLTKSVELQKINNINNNGSINVTRSNSLDKLNFFNLLDLTYNDFQDSPFYKKNFDKHSESLIADIGENQGEIVIQSDQQSELNGVISAEGNVVVEYQGKILKADNLIYDKSNKKISANGNIVLIMGDQIFKSSEIEYSFINEKGYLLDVKGSFNTRTLIEDLSSNFSLADLNTIKSLIEFKKKKVLNTPGTIENWLFYSDKINIDGETWKSKKAIFSNDLLESKQLKIVINSLQVTPEAEKIRFKSSINYLILDEKLAIPFWVGDRSVKRAGKISNFDSRWTFGYENLDKDGYFIGRKFNPLDISDNFVLQLEPQFLIQRSLKGYTKSFVSKGESITSERVKRNVSFEDYFALKSQIKGMINSWDLEIDTNLNSFDLNKFSDASRLKTKLSKEINFLGAKWNKSFYGIYRDRVWNGSLGEAEIYTGYGSKLKKENNWVVNGIKKTEIVSFGLAEITAEALNTKNLVN